MPINVASRTNEYDRAGREKLKEGKDKVAVWSEEEFQAQKERIFIQ